jgi:hypothetical protein
LPSPSSDEIAEGEDSDALQGWAENDSIDDGDDFEYDGFSDEALSSDEVDGGTSADFEEIADSDSDDDQAHQQHQRRHARGKRSRPHSDDDDDEDGQDGLRPVDGDQDEPRRRPLSPIVVPVMPTSHPETLCGTCPACMRQLPGVVHAAAAPENCEVRITRMVLVLEPKSDSAFVQSSPIYHATITHGPVPLFAHTRPGTMASPFVNVVTMPPSSPVQVLPHLSTPTTAAPPSGQPPRKSSRRETQESTFANATPPDTVPALEQEDVDWCCRVCISIQPTLDTMPADIAYSPHPNVIRPVCTHRDLVVAELSPSRPQVAVSVVIPPRASFMVHCCFRSNTDRPIEYTLRDVQPTLTIDGEYIPRIAGVSLAVFYRWFTVRAGVIRAAVTTGDGTIAFAPPGTVVEAQRIEGKLLYLADKRDHWEHSADGLKSSGLRGKEKLGLRSASRVVADLDDWIVYAKAFTPARQDKEVRVRRFPHRNADVVAVIPFGTMTVARGATCDPATGDVYAIWGYGPYCGGFSRVRGEGGLFLVETGDVLDWNRTAHGVEPVFTRSGVASPTFRLVRVPTEPVESVVTSPNGDNNASYDVANPTAPTSLVTFAPSVWFCPTSAANVPIAIYEYATTNGNTIGRIDVNELKEAVAQHTTGDGMVMLQWASGGYSWLRTVGNGGGDAFAAVPPFDQPLRSRLRTSKMRRVPSPDVIDLPAPGRFSVPPVPVSSENAASAEAERSRHRPFVDAADEDPALYKLRAQLGTITLAQYPTITLRPAGQEGWSAFESEDDDEGEESSDEDFDSD